MKPGLLPGCPVAVKKRRKIYISVAVYWVVFYTQYCGVMLLDHFLFIGAWIKTETKSKFLFTDIHQAWGENLFWYNYIGDYLKNMHNSIIVLT